MQKTKIYCTCNRNKIFMLLLHLSHRTHDARSQGRLSSFRASLQHLKPIHSVLSLDTYWCLYSQPLRTLWMTAQRNLAARSNFHSVPLLYSTTSVGKVSDMRWKKFGPIYTISSHTPPWRVSLCCFGALAMDSAPSASSFGMPISCCPTRSSGSKGAAGNQEKRQRTPWTRKVATLG